MRRTILFALVPVLLAAGCFLCPARPATPAATVRFQALDDCAPAGERYYVLVFGSQSVPKLPRYTHTWATVVRVVDQGEGREPLVEPHTISWLPVTLKVRPFAFQVEPGRNYDLPTTFGWALGTDQRVSMWGPYELRRGLYRKFVMQKQFLETGQVGYQAIDPVGEAAWCGCGLNCIHAITEADEAFGRGEHAVFPYGEDAGAFIAGELLENGGLVCPERTHDWLIGPLGLGGYPVVRRVLRMPQWRGG